MKKIIISFTFLILLISCSDFDEELKFDVPSYKDVTIENLETPFPVINLIANEEQVEKMFENYRAEIEIEARMDLYRNHELQVDRELVELEIKGGKSATFELKSLGIKFDDTQDNSQRQIINPEKILPNHSLDKIKSFRLRNSGNDFFDTMLKDATYSELAIELGLDFEVSYYEPAFVFINNEFYGMLNIRTETNSNGISRLFDKKKKHLTMVKVDSPGVIDIKDGDEARVYTLMQKIADGDVAHIKQEIDLNSFIDYMAFESLITNFDWPNNNVRFYAIEDSKFRFVLYDLDYVNEIDIANHPLKSIRNGNSSPIIDMFNVLYDNDAEFKQQFDERLEEIYNNPKFSRESFSTILNKNMEYVEKEIPLHLQKYKEPETLIEWYQNVDELRADFDDRFGYLKNKF
ncbi:CotH kinase family protein [Aureivirga marina]|uniref:CotH kinase family protein n=1 Tax=Aureivirga marina TaxID=1182451 RepID=UPI0018CB74D6|nr:CotH kinase family protein [Aureivirga marina]